MLAQASKISCRNGQSSLSSTEANKVIAHQFCEATWGRGDLTAVDQFTSPDFIVNYPILSSPLDRQGFKAWLNDVHTAFPDLQLTITEAIAEADQVVLCWIVQGTQTGSIGLLNLPPTGKAVRYTGMLIYRIVDGRIVEERGEEDALGLFRQLGLLGALST